MSQIKEPHFHIAHEIEPRRFLGPFRRLYGRSERRLRRWRRGGRLSRDAWLVLRAEDYAALFADTGAAEVIGEASVHYLCSPTAATRIRAAMPEARIIIALRNPIERAVSHYAQAVRSGWERRPLLPALRADARRPRGFGQAFRWVDCGRYAVPVERFLEAFPACQVHVCLYDDFARDSRAVATNIATFLGIAPTATPPPHLNAAWIPRSRLLTAALERSGLQPTLRPLIPRPARRLLRTALGRDRPAATLATPQARDYLRGQYATDIPRLARLLGRSLDHWLSDDN